MIDRSAWASSLVVLNLAFAAKAGDPPRINQIQVIGSHNSYHIAPHPNVQGLLGARGRVAAQALDYTHRPLPEQFTSLGIRQIELDVYADPQGGLYADPVARKILKGLHKEAGPDPNVDGRLGKPGFKVFHIQDIDFLTTVNTFSEALREVHDWSEAHPRHVPILILVELKDDAIAALPTRPAPFGKSELDALDAEIRSVFGSGEFLAPDDVRGSYASLPEAIKAKGWPTIDEARGQVFFALDNEGALRDLYLAEHPALKDRAMFVAVPPENPAAAWMKVNDPIKDFDLIQDYVKAGFLVRTRADADTAEARKNDPVRRDKALASGAQFVSTDFAEAHPEISPYRVRLDGDVVARVNPIVGDPAFAGLDLELSATAPARK